MPQIREPYRDEGDGSTRLLVPEEHNRESSFERRLAVPPRASAVATASLDREGRTLVVWWPEIESGIVSVLT